ncbi:DUF397 domain-containing protein [Streptomyces canus]|uniref:DUF397 domain-containing protein n=1 Tax=Streptomyces canus TaxID=58343 RepID=UPI002E35E9AC|nr:DUF397 domain-containing protein [Streptomyces canus]
MPSRATPRDVDLKDARWRKSSYSGGANDCVEVAELREAVALRDSKDIDRRPLLFSKAAMRALVNEIAAGQCVGSFSAVVPDEGGRGNCRHGGQ